VHPILRGSKQQTIRADRKRHAKAREDLQLFTGMRSKSCFKIGTAICLSIEPVRLDFAGNLVHIGGRDLKGWAQLNAFAQNDGFEGWLEFRDFWRIEHAGVVEFSGLLIRWHCFIADPTAALRLAA
jgi:hypothetical protein